MKYLGLAIAAVTLTGCVSAQPGPASTSAGAVRETTAPNANARCDLLTPNELRQVLKVDFSEARLDQRSTSTRTVCQWTARDGMALVRTEETSGRAAHGAFVAARDTAKRTLGPVSSVRIPGASESFQVQTFGAMGMLVNGNFVQLSALLPSATSADIRALSRLAASRSN